VAVSAIGADGLPQAAQQVIPTGPKAHAMRSDPSKPLRVRTSLGAAGDAVPLRRRQRPARANEPPALARPQRIRPAALRFHPHAPFVYLLNELDASLDVLAFDRHAGSLSHRATVSTLPAGFTGTPGRPTAHHARRALSLQQRTRLPHARRIRGRCRQRPAQPDRHSPTQTQPRGFAITPSGRYVLAAGQRFQIASACTPSMKARAHFASSRARGGHDPNWVEVIELASNRAQ
jgi:6-phosphogluconolactonase